MRSFLFVALLAVALGAVEPEAPMVSAQSVDRGWLPGPGAGGPSRLDGQVDTPAAGSRLYVGDAFQVSGWVVDVTAEGWGGIDEVRLYNGAMENEGAMLLGVGQVGRERPDVGQRLANPFWVASGFVATVPAAAFGPGTGELRVYAHSPSKGWWYRSLPLHFLTPPGRGGPRFNAPVLAVGYLLAAQIALGPLVSSALPGTRRVYLERWRPVLLVQVLLAFLGLAVVASQWRLP